MLTRERQFLNRNNIDGENEFRFFPEHYRKQAATFLFYDPEKGFLFERRIDPKGTLYGEIIIPGGSIKDPGESSFPLWTAQRECLEEIGIVAESIALLPTVFSKDQGCLLHPFLMFGILWGNLENMEPGKKELIWLALKKVFQEEAVSPMFQLYTTRNILLNARKIINENGLGSPV